MKNRLTRYNNGFIGNFDSTKSISEGTVGLSKKNTYVSENFNSSDQSLNLYSPPSQWASLPSFEGLTQYFAAVVAVYNNESNFLAFQMSTSTGNYLVDWGDGTTGSFASGAVAYKQYTTTTYSGLTTSEFRNYKTLVVTARPLSGTISSISLNNNHNQSGLQTEYVQQWLNISLVGSSINSLSIGNRSRMLEQINYIGSNSITNFSFLFDRLVSLKKVVSLDTRNATNFQGMFNGCRTLREIPKLNSQNVTNIVNMFTNCTSITYIPWMDTSKVTNLYETFWNCVSLKSLPSFNFSNVIDGFRAFDGCNSLEELPFFDFSKIGSIRLSSTIRIKKLPNFNFRSLTNAQYTFNGMYSLRELPNYDFSKSTTFTAMASSCFSLEKVPDEIDMSSCSSAANSPFMFYENYNLKKAPKIKRTSNNFISFAYQHWRNYSLEEVPQFDTSRIISFERAFGECFSLESLGITFSFPAGQTWADSNAFNLTFSSNSNLKFVGDSDVSGLSGSTYTNVYSSMFSGCNSLTYVGLSGISENFSIQNCCLGPTALNILYSRLGVVGASGAGAKTITVSGNWGAANDNPSIAIAKGWSVSG